ncbi:MAG TPA: hypothetical protein VGE52_21110 [Pirellulales bacterium]
MKIQRLLKRTRVSIADIAGCGRFQRSATSWPGSSEYVVYETLPQIDSPPAGRLLSAASFLLGLVTGLVGAATTYLL